MMSLEDNLHDVNSSNASVGKMATKTSREMLSN